MFIYGGCAWDWLGYDAKTRFRRDFIHVVARMFLGSVDRHGNSAHVNNSPQWEQISMSRLFSHTLHFNHESFVLILCT